jgi:hypothetical protein
VLRLLHCRRSLTADERQRPLDALVVEPAQQVADLIRRQPAAPPCECEVDHLAAAPGIRGGEQGRRTRAVAFVEDRQPHLSGLPTVG